MNFANAARSAVLLPAAGLLLASLADCSKGQQQAGPPPPKVTVAAPVQREVIDQDEYVGRFVAVDSVDIRSRLSGYLAEIHFKDGQMVRKGDLLFTICPSVKRISARYPDTRERISTESTATKRPTYSSRSTIVRCTGVATVTAGGGAPPCCWP